METWVVIPVHNEGRTVEDVVRGLRGRVERVICVDDGSSDDSVALLARLGASAPPVTVLRHRRNLGMAGALFTGLSYVVEAGSTGRIAAGSLVATMDGDGQHRPEDLVRLREIVLAGKADVALGRRRLDRYPWSKRVGNRLLSAWASLLTGHPYHDVECGLRVMRLETAADILPYYAARGYGCGQELGVLTAVRGWRVDNECPIEVPHYRVGARAIDGPNNLLGGALARLRANRRRPPVRRESWRAALVDGLPGQADGLEVDPSHGADAPMGVGT